MCGVLGTGMRTFLGTAAIVILLTSSSYKAFSLVFIEFVTICLLFYVLVFWP